MPYYEGVRTQESVATLEHPHTTGLQYREDSLATKVDVAADGALRALSAALDAMDRVDISLRNYAQVMEEGNHKAEVCNKFLTLLGQLSDVKSVNFDKVKDNDPNKPLFQEVRPLMEQLKEWGLNWQKPGWDSGEQRQALTTAVNQMMDMMLTKDQKYIILLKNAFTLRNQLAEIVSDMEKRQDRAISKMSENMR